MSKFGNLVIEYPAPVVKDRLHFACFDVLNARINDPYFRPNVDGVQDWIGAPVCPIGACDDGYIDLFMAESGRVYGDWERVLFVADSGKDLLERLSTESTFEVVAEGTEAST